MRGQDKTLGSLVSPQSGATHACLPASRELLTRPRHVSWPLSTVKTGFRLPATYMRQALGCSGGPLPLQGRQTDIDSTALVGVVLKERCEVVLPH
jgi:hypothetical protein